WLDAAGHRGARGAQRRHGRRGVGVHRLGSPTSRVGCRLNRLAAVVSSLLAPTFTGTGHDGAQLLFTVKLESQPQRMRVTYTDLKGRAFFTRSVDFADDGERPVAYAFTNTALGQSGKLTATATELVVELTEKDGKTKTAREPLPERYAVGPSVNRLVER